MLKKSTTIDSLIILNCLLLLLFAYLAYNGWLKYYKELKASKKEYIVYTGVLKGELERKEFIIGEKITPVTEDIRESEDYRFAKLFPVERYEDLSQEDKDLFPDF